MEEQEIPIPAAEKMLAAMTPEVRSRALLRACVAEARCHHHLDPGIVTLLERAASAGQAQAHEIERINQLGSEADAFYFDQEEEGLRDEMADLWFVTGRIAAAFVISQTDRTLEGAVAAARELARLGPGDSGLKHLDEALIITMSEGIPTGDPVSIEDYEQGGENPDLTRLDL